MYYLLSTYTFKCVILTTMEHLLHYCRHLFEQNKLIEQRKIGKFSDYESFSLDHIRTIIDIDAYDFTICEKRNLAGFSMKWHLDDASIVKHCKHRLPTHGNHIFFSDRYTIYYPKKKPVYSLIVYESSYGIDFTGGELEFCDDTIIRPERGMYILFNSDELHCVHEIKSGIRNTYLIKFYPKDPE